jgi:hypothetical protein
LRALPYTLRFSQLSPDKLRRRADLGFFNVAPIDGQRKTSRDQTRWRENLTQQRTNRKKTATR